MWFVVIRFTHIESMSKSAFNHTKLTTTDNRICLSCLVFSFTQRSLQCFDKGLFGAERQSGL